MTVYGDFLYYGRFDFIIWFSFYKNVDSSPKGDGGASSQQEYKKPKSGSGKEKATDVPSWAKGNRPYKNESGKDFAKRLCDEYFGEGNYSTKGQSDYSKLKKWGDRAFE